MNRSEPDSALDRSPGGVSSTALRLLAAAVALVATVAPPPQADARTWYVDDRIDGHPGSGSASDPFNDFQRAIDTASHGDRIQIQPGRYEAQPAALVDELCGNCQEHRTSANATVGYRIPGKGLTIAGAGAEETFLITHAGYGILFEDSPGSLLTGVTVTGGKRDRDGNATDGAVVVRGGDLEIRACHIIDNEDRAESVVVGIGGVIGREGAEIVVRDCVIRRNGWDGVALYRGATALVADNVIRDGRGTGVGITWDAVATVVRNEISGYWKGIGAFGASHAVVRNNAVHDNLGWGIIATGEAYLDATNNVVHHNGNCGIALWSDGARGRFANNVIAANGWREEWVCPRVGAWADSGVTGKGFVVAHNLFWANQEGSTRAIELIGRNGNVEADPLLLEDGTFRPAPGSPLVDRGIESLADTDGSRSDIGITGGPAACARVREGSRWRSPRGARGAPDPTGPDARSAARRSSSAPVPRGRAPRRIPGGLAGRPPR